MPKIRGFKPDLWTDETFVEVQPLARLLWMGLWSYACDNGHLDDKSKQIKLRVLPMEDCNAAELLRELEEHGLIQRADGTITIPNFAKHQRPDKRYFQTCDLPHCTRPEGDSQPKTRRGHVETTTSARGGHAVGSWGPHVDGDGDGEVMVKGSDGDSEQRGARATQLPKNWQPSDAHRSLAVERGVDLDEETAKFRDWCASNGATKKNWEATFRNWIRNARATGRPLHVAPKTYIDARNLERPPDGLTDEESAAWLYEQAAKHR